MKAKIIVSILFSLIVSAAVVFFTLKSNEQKAIGKPDYILVTAKHGRYNFPLPFDKGVSIRNAAAKFGLEGHKEIYVGKSETPANAQDQIFRDTILTFKN